MAYTTLAAVNKIISYDATLVPDPQLMIDSATIIVDTIIGDALGTPGKELVERYLAAHLIAVTDARVQSEQVKSLLVSYQHKLGLGLAITHWGSMAMFLDTSGKLANWNKQILDGMAGAFSLFWGGTDL